MLVLLDSVIGQVVSSIVSVSHHVLRMSAILIVLYYRMLRKSGALFVLTFCESLGYIRAHGCRMLSVRPCIYPIICLKSVDVRRLQVVILALSPREMSQTDRVLPRYILSRVRVSVRPRIFLYAKKPQTTVARILQSALRRSTTELEAAEARQLGGVAVTRRAVNYDVTRCECREPGSNPMQGTFFFHFYCLRLTRLTLNKS